MSKELPPSRTADQFVVRFPDGMRDRIAAAAKANNRSMNAEIVARLDESFLAKEDAADLQRILDDVSRELREISSLRQFLRDVGDRKGDADIGE